MHEFLDYYCERLMPGLWDEPLNAVSNIAFIVAAFFIWRLAKQKNRLIPAVNLLIFLAVLIGIGSGLFHTFATKWANLLDVIPILVFQLTFIWLYCRRVIRFNPMLSGTILAGFFAISKMMRSFSEVMNGSLSYLPALVILVAFTVYHFQTRKREPTTMVIAAGFFLAALTFRTMDQAVCAVLPMGTHFLWHICNGFLIYCSARALILNWSSQTQLHTAEV